jgi:peptidoglycan/LPS O-acetylase OafA/YrhL
MQVAVPHSARAEVKQGQRILELDGLRGIAILMVLAYHYLAFVPAKRSLLYYLMLPLNIGWSGVDLFFVLSGFLIGGILIDHRASPRYFSSFYLRRIHRIFPLYYGICICAAIGAWLWASPLFLSAMPLWAYLPFLQNFASFWVFTFGAPWLSTTWSLAVEEQFYMILPVMVRVLPQRAIAIFACCCLIGAPLLRAFMIFRGYEFTQIYPLFFCRCDALAYGVLAAMIVRNARARDFLTRNRTAFFIVYAISAAACTSMFKIAVFPFVGTAGYSIMDAFYFLTVLCVLIIPMSWMNRALVWKPLLWMGMVSYAVYLFHEPARYTLFWIFLHEREPAIHSGFTFGLTLAALAITLVCARLSWSLIERPLISRAHRRYQY